MGIAILTIPTFLFVLVFLLLFSCIWRRKILYPTILLVGIAGLTLIPWMVRNYYIFQEFGLTTNFGDNFIIGNNPCTTPNNGPLAYKCLDEVYHKASLLNLNEFDKSNYLTNQAMAYWKTDPLHYIHLYILKTLNYFNYRNDLATQSEASLGKDILMLISYGLLVIIGFVRLFYYKFIPITDFEKFHYLLYLLSSFVLALLFTRIRYRLPFDYCLIIIGGNFLGHLLEGWQSKSQEALV